MSKVAALARMFAGFPSYRPSAGMLSETIAVYLDVLGIYSDEEVAEACLRLTREPREFPPTAGEVRAMCEKVVIASAPPPLPRLTDESRPLANELTIEQRQENIKKFKQLVVELGAHRFQNAPVSPKTPARPAPFNFGPSLMRTLVEKGMVAVKTEDRLADAESPAGSIDGDGSLG